MFSFQAERKGGREIIGIDHDLSVGAVEFLIPFFGSKVQMYQMNLLELEPTTFGLFDVILLPGVLYHLRYPFWSLSKTVNCLNEKGVLLIESGMLADPRMKDYDLLYCPVEDSPYEITSCTFFNQRALVTTMRSFHCKLLYSNSIHDSEPPHLDSPPRVNRSVLIFQKDSEFGPGDEPLERYWHTTHGYHSSGKF
jgi:hypothetical protein